MVGFIETLGRDFDLFEYCVHYPGGQQDFSIRYRYRDSISNRAIKSLEKILLVAIHMKVHFEKKTGVME